MYVIIMPLLTLQKKKKKKSNEFKAFINIVWDADRSNEFVERLENLGVADKLADLLQKEKKMILIRFKDLSATAFTKQLKFQRRKQQRFENKAFS